MVHHALEKNFVEPADPLPHGEVPVTAPRLLVWELMRRMGGLAGHKQSRTHSGMKLMLSLHLAATSIAAISATVLYHFTTEAKGTGWLIYLLGLAGVLALLKPLLAGWAWWIEHRSHEDHDREHWLNARVLQELCRGALSTWPLPLQPIDAADEEDFPRIKRMIRTLRLMRELDPAAGVQGSTRNIPQDLDSSQAETQLEADMRVAVKHYVGHRLEDQAAGYYRRKLKQHQTEERRWRLLLHLALASTILAGSILAFHEIAGWVSYLSQESGGVAVVGAGHSLEWFWKTLKALVIIGPFVAAFTLSMMTVLDCRRRVKRYPEMDQYLTRIHTTLDKTAANSSRLRLIEQAERLMIEEQHEWFSVARNFNV